MPSFTSNFKRRLRLPRLFFRKPPEIESIHGGPPLEYVRPIPQLPWCGITVAVVLIVISAAFAWELYCRSIGYGPTLHDNEDLWSSARRRVKPESIAIIGDSRGWYDLDLGELEKGLGKRPVQLAMGGSCAYPVLADLATKIFTAPSFAVLSPVCLSRRRARRRWITLKKPFGGLTHKHSRNVPANISTCRWKNMSHF